MPEMDLQQAEFTCNVCRPFTKSKKRILKFKEIEIQDTFIKTNWIKLALNMIWLMDFFKDMSRRTTSDKLLCTCI